MEDLSVKSICDVISEQMGLSLKCAEYLEKRRVVIVSNGMAARDFTKGLCELNGWVVTQDANNKSYFRVERPGPKRVSLRKDLSAAVRKLFPNDLANYCSFDKLESPDPGIRLTAAFENPPTISRIDKLLEQFLESVVPYVSDNKIAKYESLKNKDRDTLNAYHLFRNFQRTFDVVYDIVGVHHYDAETMQLKLDQGKVLMISGLDKLSGVDEKSHTRSGFGQNVIDR